MLNLLPIWTGARVRRLKIKAFGEVTVIVAVLWRVVSSRQDY